MSRVWGLWIAVVRLSSPSWHGCGRTRLRFYQGAKGGTLVRDLRGYLGVTEDYRDYISYILGLYRGKRLRVPSRGLSFYPLRLRV